ncbi:MAG TPA: tRNA lysidine(34) synthetase TilS [Thermoanaerobaculia bacterium]|nr:tRNA lysidine(34) synthetase TilS [Thermoanaerobaculia bacterium]
MQLLEGLQAFFRQLPLAPGDRLVIAFSGGVDSTALLWGLGRLAPPRGIQLVAAHLDHAMDPGSAGRATRAACLARRLGVPLVSARRAVPARRRTGESLEAAARRVRYQFLEEVRRGCRARYVATAHHRDDQAETVLLRLRFGSGLRGLAGIRPVAGAVVRPLLELPRTCLARAVVAAGLTPSVDPGNADPRQPRALMRHRVLPALARAASPAGSPGDETAARAELAAALAGVAARALRATAALDRRLAAAIGMPAAARPGSPGADRRLATAIDMPGETAGSCPPASDAAIDPPRSPAADPGGFLPGDAAGSWPPDGPGGDAAVDPLRLAALPPALLAPAMALLHRRAGAAFPASLAAAGELRRQLGRARGRLDAHTVACDCGGGWRWQAAGQQLWLRRQSNGEPIPPFTYTLEVPGELAIPEIGLTVRVSLAAVEPWMLRGEPHRAGLSLPLVDSAGGAGRLTVRNRRPGDRLLPLGSPGSRKLKELMIDRGLPWSLRDRLPLLCWAGEIAWVPGLAIGHRFRLAGQTTACLAEVVGPFPGAAASQVGRRGGLEWAQA